MDDLIEFLTSSQSIIVYIVAILSCLACIIVYIVEVNNDKLRKRHNTKELNKLVEKIQEIEPEEERVEEVNYDVPVLQPIDETESSKVLEMLENTKELRIEQKEMEIKEPEIEQMTLLFDDVEINEEKKSVEEEKVIETQTVEKQQEKKEELQYTSIEPDQATAKLELKKITEALKKEQENIENIALTNYETEQEENAIISLQELVTRAKDMYAQNEMTQYQDEGNEPISLADLETKMNKKVENIVESFKIDKVVPEKELEDTKEFEEASGVKIEDATKFHSSPIISPIYGIENSDDKNEKIELENTANYEKLDEEVKKTNEFLMSLKELQSKLN